MKFILFLMAILFWACTDSTDYLYEEKDAHEVSINAMMARTMSASKLGIKNDTILFGDSLIFLVDVLPTKSMRMQRYYWTINGAPFASEFNFKRQMNTLGYHEIIFVFVDILGDSLMDTLNLWVTAPPVLNLEKIIPRHNSKEITPNEALNFVWSEDSFDTLTHVNYTFTLFENGEEIFQKIVSTPRFTYHGKLEPLTKYEWTLQAKNALGYAAVNEIKNAFYTAGALNEAAIIAHLKTSDENRVKVHFALYDKNEQLIREGETNENFAIIKPLPAGQYTLKAQVVEFSDFTSISKAITLNAKEVFETEDLFLTDTVKPKLQWIDFSGNISENDTIEFADTLKFLITENGGELYKVDINPATAFEIKKDTLFVFLNDAQKSWTNTLLDISLTDNSMNFVLRHFVLKPSIFWFEINNDTTLYDNETLILSFQDNNPYSFAVKSFFVVIEGVKDTLFIAPKPNLVQTLHSLKAENFTDSLTKIYSGVRYINGVTKVREWHLNRIFKAREDDE